MKLDVVRLSEALRSSGCAHVHVEEHSLVNDLQTRLTVLTSCMLGLDSDFCGMDLGALRGRAPSTVIQGTLAKLLLDMGLVPPVPSLKGGLDSPDLEVAMALVAGDHRVKEANTNVFNELTDLLEVNCYTKACNEGLDKEYKRCVRVEDVVLKNQAAVYSKGCSILPTNMSTSDRAKARTALTTGQVSLSGMRQQNMLLASELRKLEAELGTTQSSISPDMTDPDAVSSLLTEWNATLSSLLKTGATFTREVQGLDINKPAATPAHDKLGDLATSLYPLNNSLANIPATTTAVRAILDDLQNQAHMIRSDIQTAPRADVSWAAECAAVL
eukprot:TRINITY_DN28405_c0_g1_i1.p1 TRINITY_DN28405_c0_g1~~TRINITY_DN28405_c0_g1_i1.p1  ORF type:complete len:329 (+),score=68.17 TRINITY_DN28405_c0_g1_i1:45-1031(+)